MLDFFVWFVLIMQAVHKTSKIYSLSHWSIKALKTRTHMGVIVEGQRRWLERFSQLRTCMLLFSLFIHLDQRRISESKVSFPRTQHSDLCHTWTQILWSLVQRTNHTTMSPKIHWIGFINQPSWWNQFILPYSPSTPHPSFFRNSPLFSLDRGYLKPLTFCSSVRTQWVSFGIAQL